MQVQIYRQRSDHNQYCCYNKMVVEIIFLENFFDSVSIVLYFSFYSKYNRHVFSAPELKLFTILQKSLKSIIFVAVFPYDISLRMLFWSN